MELDHVGPEKWTVKTLKSILKFIGSHVATEALVLYDHISFFLLKLKQLHSGVAAPGLDVFLVFL